MSAVERCRNSIIKVYYHLTAYIPRRLPNDQAEFVEFAETMKKYFGLEDRHDVWITVCGQITSTPPTSLRKSWGSIANAAKRLQVNKTAHDQKTVAIQALQVMLKEKMEELTKDGGMTDHEIVQKASEAVHPA